MAARGSCRNARGLQWEVVLTDIAEGGCRIADPARHLATGEQVRLTIAGTGPHHARVCWHRGGAAGLAFARPLAEDLLEQIAAAASAPVPAAPTLVGAPAQPGAAEVPGAAPSQVRRIF